jgi:hypothetical protein
MPTLQQKQIAWLACIPARVQIPAADGCRVVIAADASRRIAQNEKKMLEGTQRNIRDHQAYEGLLVGDIVSSIIASWWAWWWCRWHLGQDTCWVS